MNVAIQRIGFLFEGSPIFCLWVRGEFVMEVLSSYYTNAGNVKTTNQDSLSVEVVNSPNGRIVFAVVCDGMGGLDQGELASKEVVLAFEQWFYEDFAKMVANESVIEQLLFAEWKRKIDFMNQKLMEYGTFNGTQIGTTLTMLLVYQGRYYISHVGDSRIYKITKELVIMTEDHTVVGHELRMGMITPEQAECDPRKNMLVQCVGASVVIEQQMVTGTIMEDATFILCSDGFVHKLSQDEIYKNCRPELLKSKKDVTHVCARLSRLAMERGERDNVTVVGIVLKNME